MHPATTSNNAFAKWETLGPPTTTSSSSTSWAALSPSSKVDAVAPAAFVQRPKQQQAQQPPPAPNGSADIRPHGSSGDGSDSLALGGGRGRSRRVVPSPSPAPTDGRQATSDRAPGAVAFADDHASERSAAAPGVAPGGPAPASFLLPELEEVPTSSPARIPPPQLVAARVPQSSGGTSGSGGGGGGGGGGVVGEIDGESLLARLAGKAKQAAAAALSASAASSSSGAERTSLAVGGALLRAETTAAPAAIGSTPDVAGGPGDYVSSTADRPSEDGEGGSGDQWRGPGLRKTAAAVVEAGGSARLSELCKEDKAKVARLMQDLVKLRSEKDGQRSRFERLRAQNELIVREMAALKVKFGQSMQLLRKYQGIIQDGKPAAGRGAGVSSSVGVDGVGSPPAESPAAAATATDLKALREALRTAEEASRKAKAEVTAEHAGRLAMAEELRMAKEQADDLQRRLDHHLRAEEDNPVASREQGRQNPVSLQTAPAWSRGQARAGPALGTSTPLSAGGGDRAAVGHVSVFPSTSTVGNDDARPASPHGSQAMIVGGVPGHRATSADGRALGRSPDLQQHQLNGTTWGATTNGGGATAVAAAVVAAGGGDRGSVPPPERRRQGEEGDAASNAELAALKEQVETLKQQLVMVGVQQLALTGVPTGAALLNQHAFPFRPAPPAADHPVAGEGTLAANGGVEPPNFDRPGAMRSHQQQQQRVPGRTMHSRRARRGRDGYDVPPGEQTRGLVRSDSGEGAGTPTGEFAAAEDILFDGRERPPGGAAGADGDDDEEGGWWARSADKLLVLRDAIQPKPRAVPNGSENHGSATATTTDIASDYRCTRTGVAPKTPAGGAAGGGQSCDDRVSSYGVQGKARLTADLPPAISRKPFGAVEAGRPRPAGGRAHRDVDVERGTVAVADTGAPTAFAAGSGGGRLRVSWSSVSAVSSDSDVEREFAPTSSVASARSNCSGSSSSSSSSSRSSRTGRRRCRRHSSDTSGAVLPRPWALQQRRQQEQLQQRRRRQQQVGSSYHRVSPSSCSSSSVSSRAFGWRNLGMATEGQGGESRGASAGRGVVGAGRRHHHDKSAEAVSGGVHRVLKARAGAVPRSRRQLTHRAPIANRNTTTDVVGDEVSAPPTAKPAGHSRRLLGDSVRRGRDRSPAHGGSSLDGGGGGGGSGRVRGLMASSSARQQAGGVSGCETADAVGRWRAPAGVTMDHSNGEDFWGRGPTEAWRDRRLRRTTPDDDDAIEVLELEGGSFFDGSLLDLIDDLEEESNEAAHGSSSRSRRPSSSTGSGGMCDGGGWRVRRGEDVSSLSSQVAALPLESAEELRDDSVGAIWRHEGDGC